jgi:hypothetical protein
MNRIRGTKKRQVRTMFLEDGRYMTLSDEGATGHEEGIVRVTISRSSLRDAGRTLLDDTCYSGWEIELAPYRGQQAPASQRTPFAAPRALLSA